LKHVSKTADFTKADVFFVLYWFAASKQRFDPRIEKVNTWVKGPISSEK
jgi:hypothetical protein